MQKKFGLSLCELDVTNFATFSNQKVNFDNKFNAIIGETGSGKSLILEALQLILGQRADKRIVRKGSEFAVIEALFKCECPRITKYLDELGYPFENGEILIKRIIYKSGKTKSFLNLQTCSLNTIINFTSNFVDLVGQFENQKLLSSKYQLQLLDEYADLSETLDQYKKNYKLYMNTKDELNVILNKSNEIAQRTDYLNYQIDELEKLTPTVADETLLIANKKEFQNSDEHKKRLEYINKIFEGTENQQGLMTLIKSLEAELSSDIVPEKELSNFYNAQGILEDLNYSLNSMQVLEFDESAFSKIIDRLDYYQTLKRKFKVDTEGLEKILEEFKLERQEAHNLESSIELYKERLTLLNNKNLELAKVLHKKRLTASVQLAKELTNSIQALNMKGAQIRFDIIEREVLNSHGNSDIIFCAETNPGEGFFPIKDIASGGELSRILLSIRNVLSSKDSISIFLFDEIDTGIGGETALTIGKALAEIANSSQVIAITHLPQIANNATKLVIVSKELIENDNDKRTISLVKEVQGLDIKKEVELMTPLN